MCLCERSLKFVLMHGTAPLRFFPLDCLSLLLFSVMRYNKTQAFICILTFITENENRYKNQRH